MKTKLLILLAFIVTAITTNAQYGVGPAPTTSKETATDDPNKVYNVTDQKAEPPYNLMQYLSSNLQYPQEALEAEIEGRVTIKFIIEKDGSITNVTVVKGNELKHGLPQEAIRVIKSMPKWNPAKQNGKLVRMAFSIPIVFKLT